MTLPPPVVTQLKILYRLFLLSIVHKATASMQICIEAEKLSERLCSPIFTWKLAPKLPQNSVHVASGENCRFTFHNPPRDGLAGVPCHHRHDGFDGGSIHLRREALHHLLFLKWRNSFHTPGLLSWDLVHQTHSCFVCNPF